ISESGNRRADEDDGPARVPEETRGRFRERSVHKIRELGAENSLRDQLNGHVERSRNRKREEDRLRHRARRIFDFPTWHQRQLDAHEGEYQEQNGLAYRFSPGPGGPAERIAFDKEN